MLDISGIKYDTHTIRCSNWIKKQGDSWKDLITYFIFTSNMNRM